MALSKLLFISICSILLTCMMKKNSPESSAPSAQMLPTLEFFHALISNGQDVLVADQTGNFNIGNLESGPRCGAKTELDRAHLAIWQNNFVTAGQWNPEVAVWEPQKGHRLLNIQPFNGRITALAANPSTLYVAGADHDTTAASVDEFKDAAVLLPGKIATITPQGQIEWLNTDNKGSIEHLAAGLNWFAYSDDARPGTITGSFQGTEKDFQIGQNPVTALCCNPSTIWLADDDAIWRIDVVSEKLQQIHLCSSDFPRILKMVEMNDILFLMTSEGVFQTPSFKRISKHPKQATDIAVHGENLLILWENGSIDSVAIKSGTTQEFRTFANQ